VRHLVSSLSPRRRMTSGYQLASNNSIFLGRPTPIFVKKYFFFTKLEKKQKNLEFPENALFLKISKKSKKIQLFFFILDREKGWNAVAWHTYITWSP